MDAGLRTSFHRFADLLPEDGTLIINKNIEKMEHITSGLSCNIITYSETQEADYAATNITFDEVGNASFDFIRLIRLGDDSDKRPDLIFTGKKSAP